MADDNKELWNMPIVEALPLIVERFSVSEAEAYKMWRKHLKPGPPPLIDDIEIVRDEEHAERVHQRHNAPGVHRRKLFGGRKIQR